MGGEGKVWATGGDGGEKRLCGFFDSKRPAACHVVERKANTRRGQCALTRHNNSFVQRSYYAPGLDLIRASTPFSLHSCCIHTTFFTI